MYKLSSTCQVERVKHFPALRFHERKRDVCLLQYVGKSESQDVNLCLEIMLFIVLRCNCRFCSRNVIMVPASVQEAAAKDLLRRLLPSHLSSFEFKIVSKDACGGESCFLINNHDQSGQNGPEITIRGTTAVEIASGLHWYLKYWCGAHVSWDKTGSIQTAPIPKPRSLPPLKDEGLMIKRSVPWNYYQNVVTSSWHDWAWTTVD
ncbi:hypothetical protein K1719_014426 [Acacia pycnantha]|nr:hypothetical protein K1719_014426 [Acacia pycnantha]